LTHFCRAERLQVLDAVQAADLKVLRLFISETFDNFKNTGSVYMPDIEPEQVGHFDDTQLAAIDQLMVEAHERGKHDGLPERRLVTDLALRQTSSLRLHCTIAINWAAGATILTSPNTTYQRSTALTGKPATTM
jgi:hypothetical protein